MRFIVQRPGEEGEVGRLAQGVVGRPDQSGSFAADPHDRTGACLFRSGVGRPRPSVGPSMDERKHPVS